PSGPALDVAPVAADVEHVHEGKARELLDLGLERGAPLARGERGAVLLPRVADEAGAEVADGLARRRGGLDRVPALVLCDADRALVEAIQYARRRAEVVAGPEMDGNVGGRVRPRARERGERGPRLHELATSDHADTPVPRGAAVGLTARFESDYKSCDLRLLVFVDDSSTRVSDHGRASDLYEWCRIPAQELAGHPGLRVPFRLVADAREMGEAMAHELVALVEANNARGLPTRAIVPCGPSSWYAPWTSVVNARQVSLARLTVFHMDECLDWQGRPLPAGHPYNFRTFMERHFYGGIAAALNVPEAQRFWLTPETIPAVRDAIAGGSIDITLGGWGQDGHVAYNQARRHPFHHATLEDVASSTI